MTGKGRRPKVPAVTHSNKVLAQLYYLKEDGNATWLEVATASNVFIFDMLRLGEQAFVEGLQALFEDSNIVKVIHDCRWVSDMMHEKYHIRMVNIFDTQVANAFVYKILHNGDWPRYVEGLPGCLIRHLKLPRENVYFPKIRERSSEKDQYIWLQRPLSDKLVSETKKNVSYLTQLYKVLLGKLLYEFRIGVELYMNHVRKLNGEIESCKKQGYLLPYIFLEIPKLVNYTYANDRGAPATKSHVKGFQDNNIRIADKQIIFSHDSVWHKKGSGLRNINSTPMERKGPAGAKDFEEKSNINNTNNTSKMSGRGDAYDSNIKAISAFKNSSNKLSNETQQVSISGLKEKTHNMKYQLPESSPSRTGKSNSSSKIDSNNEHLENTEVETFDESESNADLPVLKNTGNGQKASFLGGAEHTKNFSEKSSSVHKNNIFEQQAEHVLPTENINVTTVHPSSGVGSKIHNSKLWLAVHAKRSPETPKLPFLQTASTVHSSQQEILTSNGTGQDFIPEIHAGKSVCRSSSGSFESDIAPPATPHPLGFSVISHLSSSSNSSLDNTTNSDNETTLAPPMTTQMDIIPGKGSDSLSVIPAGFGERQISRKKMRNIQKKSISTDSQEKNETTSLLTSPLEDDFGYIPMQGSLKRQQELPLGVTAIGFGDPFSDTECILQHPEDPKSFIESCLASNDESSLEDSDIETFQQSELFQKTLKLASSSSSINLRSKLLPPKVSPSGDMISLGTGSSSSDSEYSLQQPKNPNP